MHYQQDVLFTLYKCSFCSSTVNQFKDEAKGTRKIVFRDKGRMGPRHRINQDSCPNTTLTPGEIIEIASPLIFPSNVIGPLSPRRLVISC